MWDLFSMHSMGVNLVLEISRVFQKEKNKTKQTVDILSSVKLHSNRESATYGALVNQILLYSTQGHILVPGSVGLNCCSVSIFYCRKRTMGVIWMVCKTNVVYSLNDASLVSMVKDADGLTVWSDWEVNHFSYLDGCLFHLLKHFQAI